MKLFLYVFISVFLLGGCYLLFIHESPKVETPSTAWEAESQTHLTNLLADQIKAAQSQDWKPFAADLEKADAHLAAAPAGTNTNSFRLALQAYHSQQDMRAQLPQ